MTKKVTTKKDDRPWDHRLVRNAGRAMKRARGAKSARWLSDETTALGHPMAPTILAKLDSGHRGGVLNVTELLVLAAALNMPPALLLFGGYPDKEVEFLPGRTAPAALVVDWFCGRGRLPGAEELGPHNLGIELVSATEAHIAAQRETLTAQAMDKGPLRDDLLADIARRQRAAVVRIAEIQSELGDEN
jgi:hypothetical protein